MNERWKPNLQNVNQRIPKGYMLKKSAMRLYKNGIVSSPIGVLSDEHGVYGYRFSHFILLAKDYIFGNLISAHKSAIGTAIAHAVPIVIYINECDKFYEFNPEELMGEENVKGKALMCNFNINLGKLYEV